MLAAPCLYIRASFSGRSKWNKMRKPSFADCLPQIRVKGWTGFLIFNACFFNHWFEVLQEKKKKEPIHTQQDWVVIYCDCLCSALKNEGIDIRAKEKLHRACVIEKSLALSSDFFVFNAAELGFKSTIHWLSSKPLRTRIRDLFSFVGHWPTKKKT